MRRPALDGAHPDYRLFTFGERQVLAVPRSAMRVRRASVRCCPRDTPRKALYRAFLMLSVSARLDRFVGSTVPMPLPRRTAASISEWLGDPGSATREKAGWSFVVRWPPQLDRGRVYVHVLDGSGAAVCFLKVSLDTHNDRTLTREAATLADVARLAKRNFEVPAVLRVWRPERHVVLALAALPDPDRRDRRLGGTFPAAAVGEYSGHRRAVGPDDVLELSWFRDWEPPWDTIHERFLTELSSDRRPWVVCRAHGDLGTHNVVRAGGRSWIFDWEESAADAPHLADRVGFELSRLSRKLARRPTDWRGIVDRAAPGLGLLPRRDLIRALVFRTSRRMADANIIMRNWDRSGGWGQP